MANGVRINNLNQATSLNDTDTITIIQDDENKKASISLLDKDGTYMQSVVNTIQDLITTSKANVETTKQAIDEKFGDDKFSTHIVTSQAMSNVGVSDDGSVDVSSQVQDGFMESAVLYGKTQYHDTTADVYYDSMPEDTTGMTLELVSVKMPILKTTGKNLFNKKDVEFNYAVGNTTPVNKNYVSSNFIKVKPSTQYAINDSLPVVVGFDINKKMINKIKDTSKSGTFTTPDNCYFIRIRNYNPSTDHQSLIDNAQLEIGSSVTAYEPYKSSILSCNEDVELRGIGDIRDELNIMTGEISNNFNKITIDGTEDWQKSSNETELTVRYRCNNTGVSILKENMCICDSYNVGINTTGDNLTVAFVNTTLTYRVLKSKCPTVEDFKQWLNNNHHTIIYQTKKSIKTVDLNSSNGDVKTPVVYKNGHILLQSDGLVPELHYSIPVSYSGLIAQNTMTNLKHSWRLDELEIMAYTSIVNSQYESLILVATAETNEVVVSSDYVPDEYLYNMLKVLVDANALENADEKINVFYLYGKLSDEMYMDLIMGDDM